MLILEDFFSTDGACSRSVFFSFQPLHTSGVPQNVEFSFLCVKSGSEKVKMLPATRKGKVQSHMKKPVHAQRHTFVTNEKAKCHCKTVLDAVSPHP